jgi:MOSC domain-containing protein YiiM
VSAKPHIGCNQFLDRFGQAAFHLSVHAPRVRGIYLTVVSDGSAGVGDAVQVLRRGPVQ